MKKKLKIKPVLYFVFLAPILAKILEWAVQMITWGNYRSFLIQSVFSNFTWLAQLAFIELLSMVTFGVFLLVKKTKPKYILFVPAIAYFLKEVFNFSLRNVLNGDAITLGYAQIIALTIEPLVVLLFLGFLPYKIFFNRK
jgi:hypothetical protein